MENLIETIFQRCYNSGNFQNIATQSKYAFIDDDRILNMPTFKFFFCAYYNWLDWFVHKLLFS